MDYSQVISYIDNGNKFWLNFAMQDEDKRELLVSGMLSAAHFLHKFDWHAYKRLRHDLYLKEMKLRN